MKKVILLSVALATPFLAAAQGAVRNVQDLISFVGQVLGWLMPLIVGLAVIYFVFGILKYVMNAGDEEKQKEGRSMMLYGIIAIFVMVSVWGLINVLVGTFGLDTTAVQVPTLPTI